MFLPVNVDLHVTVKERDNFCSHMTETLQSCTNKTYPLRYVHQLDEVGGKVFPDEVVQVILQRF